MKYFILTFLFLNSSFAKVLKPQEESIYKQSCLSDYYNSPWVKSFFNNDMYSEIAWPFILEVDKYCNCDVKKTEEDIREKKKDWIAYAFKDKSNLLSKKDQCAVSNFSESNIKIHYAARFFQWFSPQIYSKIEDYSLPSMKKIVSENSYSNYITCFHDEVVLNCSKIKSLSLTYKCIKNEFEIDNYYKHYGNCQAHLYENNELLEIMNSGENNFI